MLHPFVRSPLTRVAVVAVALLSMSACRGYGHTDTPPDAIRQASSTERGHLRAFLQESIRLPSLEVASIGDGRLLLGWVRTVGSEEAALRAWWMPGADSSSAGPFVPVDVAARQTAAVPAFIEPAIPDSLETQIQGAVRWASRRGMQAQRLSGPDDSMPRKVVPPAPGQ
jgi:hypothetical protein